MKRVEKIFKDEEEFIDFVNQLNHLSNKGKEEIIKEEKDHFNRAVELGYSAQYAYKERSIGIFSRIITFRAYRIRVEGLKNPQHLREICSAPGKNMSLSDKVQSAFPTFYMGYVKLRDTIYKKE